jgi:8-oxo-dGTP pyrophosphatase MutT (NUDIX family)
MRLAQSHDAHREATTILRLASERLLRPLLHLYWRVSRGLTFGVRAVVLDSAGRIFLVWHGYTPGWHLPGGGVEPGETMVAALTRELREEGNIEITIAPRLHGVFFNHNVSARDHVAVFVVRDFRQDSLPRPNMEIVEHGFFPVDALPDKTTEATRARVSEVVYGSPIKEEW